jgi:hypothetical protein
MTFEKLVKTAFLAAAISLVAACASSPADAPSAPSAPAAATAPAASPPAASAEAMPEADAATLAEKKFQEAARSYRKVEKDGKTMYCKKEKPINSTIPRMQCVTESQLRLEVEQMEETRDRMRNSGRCTRGPGCSGGG